MTDLDMTRLCAEAMGYITETSWGPVCQVRCEVGVGIARFQNTTAGYWTQNYDPLHDDAQAMALVKRLKLHLCPSIHGWDVWPTDDDPDSTFNADGPDVNRCICECVAKMQAAK